MSSNKKPRNILIRIGAKLIYKIGKAVGRREGRKQGRRK